MFKSPIHFATSKRGRVSIADFLSFLPLRDETILDVRARFDADVNAGLDPSDAAFTDTTVGGFYYDASQPAAMECVRLWDFFSNEVPAVTFPAYAYGEYLDEHGVTINVPRKDQVKATGTVTFSGLNGTLIPAGTEVSTVQTSPDTDPLAYVTTVGGIVGNQATPNGTVDLPVEAVQAGAGGNTAAGSVTALVTGIENISAVTNAAAITGGADVESDNLYRERILLEYAAPHGAGTVADYKRWALGFPPVGFVTVEPLWAGAGTVRVIVTDQSDNPVSDVVKNGLQALLDPVAGQGQGLAPIGAIVTVATVTLDTINITVTLTLASGYSLDGSAGTHNVTPDVGASIREYIDKLNPGDDVILNRVIEQIMAVPGITDLSTLRLNGSGANVVVGSLQVARTGSIVLS